MQGHQGSWWQRGTRDRTHQGPGACGQSVGSYGNGAKRGQWDPQGRRELNLGTWPTFHLLKVFQVLYHEAHIIFKTLG